VSESIKESDTELTIETFVDRMMEIYYGLDRQEFHDPVITAGPSSRTLRYARQICRGSQKTAGSMRRKKASHVSTKEDSGV
jgi:hypothetical protein